jgi:hypothetical protein
MNEQIRIQLMIQIDYWKSERLKTIHRYDHRKNNQDEKNILEYLDMCNDNIKSYEKELENLKETSND